ncbi:MAG: TonB-dependent receptor [Balneolia bacterium]|nr:TonB-dependent receptor [Balneolia bacterium]
MAFAVLVLLWLAPWGEPSVVYANDADKTESSRGVVKGTVINIDEDSPVSNAAILIEELDRGTVSHRNGDFQFRNVPAGTYLLRVQHVGYDTGYQQITVTAGDTTFVEIGLRRGVIRSADVVVRDHYMRDDETTGVERVLTGRQLRQQLGQTIAETLEDEPGLAQRSMGPAPARPVLRGLGGDRLLILEDGGRTGDLSATAADHALAIEPMTAEHIELIRGPSALVHGSNTLGGVINVIRGQIPMDHPDHIHASGTLQGQSVNNGVAGGLRAFGPISSSLAYRVDGSVRTSGDMNTPEGRLGNTGITTLNASAGVSYIREWGMVGVSGNILDTKYGVPGGIGIADAHPNGVDIEMFRRYAEFRSRVNFGQGFFRRLDTDATYSFYKHDELEKPDFETNRRIVGSSFGVLTTNVKSHLHHNSFGIIDKGLIGIWGEHRDYASGAFSQTPETIEQAFAIYSFQEANPGNWNLQAALRFDHRTIQPQEERLSILIGDIRERSFSGVSASARVAYLWQNRIKTGLTVMRSFRAPGIEELYSEGPHLANFSYEKGNPDLNSESGFGSELFVDANFSRGSIRAAVYRNQMNNFIFPRNTDQRATRRDDLNVYRYSEERVLMTGLELSGNFRIAPSWQVSGSVNAVRGDFIADGDSYPLARFGSSEIAVPMMPPLSGRLNVEWSRNYLALGGTTRFAGAQNRLDEFEERTAGYMLFDAYAQYSITTGSTLHTFTLNVENIANTTYRNHLSRIKEIYPEPGTNVSLLYRFYF